MQLIQYIIIIILTILGSLVALINGLFDWKGSYHGKIMRSWSKMVLFCTGVKLDVTDLKNLKDANPALIVMNHESALDIPVIIAALPIDLRFIFKIELARFPIFGWALWLGNHIAINRSKPKQAIRQINEKSGKVISLGYNIVIAPEGTRSIDGKIQKFNLPIISVTMIGNRFCNPKKSFSVKSGKLKIVIDKAVKPSDYENIDICIKDIRKKMILSKEKYEPVIQEAFGA